MLNKRGMHFKDPTLGAVVCTRGSLIGALAWLYADLHGESDQGNHVQTTDVACKTTPGTENYTLLSPCYHLQCRDGDCEDRCQGRKCGIEAGLLSSRLGPLHPRSTIYKDKYALSRLFLLLVDRKITVIVLGYYPVTVSTIYYHISNI